jgi:ADP-L-glycero-D-manno-heptose 6-epimerase
MRIIVTGANGFIGSVLAHRLMATGHEVFQIDKNNREETFSIIADAIVHLGAITDTLCHDENLLAEMNLNYSKRIWQSCYFLDMRLIYASSAATYGDGSQGFDDDIEKLELLKPLNPYAESKHQFDLWTKQQSKIPYPKNWAGLKFFNVYGPDEHSKDKMASMVYQAMQQAKINGEIKLFKYGEQLRDWVYVGDVCNVIEFFLTHPCSSIYNVGSGESRSFNDIANACFKALGKEPKIEYFDMPENMRTAYQSFSKAELSKLRKAGFEAKMTNLEDGIDCLI